MSSAEVQLRSLLLGTDFRLASEDALQVAAKLVTMLNGKLSVVHVSEPSSLGVQEHAYQKKLEKQLLLGVTQRLGESGATIANTATAEGPLVPTLLELAKQNHAGLIVVGAGESTAGDRYCLSDTAESLILHSSLPVLAVRPGNPQLSFRKILCAVDHSPTSAAAIDLALALTRGFNAELIVLSVVPQVSWWSAVMETRELLAAQKAHDANWKRDCDEFLARHDLTGIKWHRESRYGVPQAEIRAAVSRFDVDLIVAGATGKNCLQRLLIGGTARQLLRDLPCSILIARQP